MAARSSGPAPAGFLRAGPARHPRRSARTVLCHAGAAQIPQIRALGRPGHHRHRQAAGDGAARCGFHLTLDGRKALDLAAEADLLDGRLQRLARIMGRDFGDNAVQVEAAREGVTLTGYAGLPTYNRANAADAVPVRQWPAGARQAADRRGARRLCRFPGARPPSGAGAVPGLRSRLCGCECPSRQDGSALPRCRAGARADRGRAETCAGAKPAIAPPPPWRARRCRRFQRQAPISRQPFRPAAIMRRADSPCDTARRCSQSRPRRSFRRGWKRRRRSSPPRHAAGRGAGAIARNLCRGPDRRRHRDRGPACRA